MKTFFRIRIIVTRSDTKFNQSFFPVSIYTMNIIMYIYSAHIKQQKYKFFKAQWSILHMPTPGPQSMRNFIPDHKLLYQE